MTPEEWAESVEDRRTLRNTLNALQTEVEQLRKDQIQLKREASARSDHLLLLSDRLDRSEAENASLLR